MGSGDKVREARLRRMAERQRMRLVKVRRRDPLAWDYGTYQLIDAISGDIVAHSLELDAVERRLAGQPPPTAGIDVGRSH